MCVISLGFADFKMDGVTHFYGKVNQLDPRPTLAAAVMVSNSNKVPAIQYIL
jgi:hypothetical protein